MKIYLFTNSSLKIIEIQCCYLGQITSRSSSPTSKVDIWLLNKMNKSINSEEKKRCGCQSLWQSIHLSKVRNMNTVHPKNSLTCTPPKFLRLPNVAMVQIVQVERMASITITSGMIMSICFLKREFKCTLLRDKKDW